MTVAQLLKVLETMPGNAVVMIAGDAGIARVGGVDRYAGSFGMPNELLLVQPTQQAAEGAGLSLISAR